MSRAAFHTVHSPSPEASAHLAQHLAPAFAPGDVILLDGDIGAGKTHFARNLIQALQGPEFAEDVPSPTFTLVQTYDTPMGEVWHADLYRLGDVSDVFELGMDEAFETALCLIEWPDRLGPAAPDTALTLRLATRGETGRSIAFVGDHCWQTRLAPYLERTTLK
ncbi:tRNA (adenosine(37)-N6)-threonylcarbamoyltransferase complex ATPase subunit type 1 TsaE [Oceaniglobus ichthyenteri]|uniref:tRNA (adenosine(37)-N6)-threonylcarbamoyltransferase complex ATPase subunit type 1 TsaE n=1 Tax=Oceaniglobus ichthyenteri TaxID=2136177 RepID=UPI000D37DEF8|nr:tRNA (adenosine(37)-N6)-threonylcarbamoyltransferase complex ATPase subunit type 1 TsaE [Oceaniglobus ichthyenteri]